jgi:hypothetical protein
VVLSLSLFRCLALFKTEALIDQSQATVTLVFNSELDSRSVSSTSFNICL